MNKLLTKIVGVVLGTTMAVGVGIGVAVNSDRKDIDSQVSASTGTLNVTTTGENSDGVLSATPAKASGSNAPITATVNSHSGIRMYANNTLTISSTETITSFSIPFYKNGSKQFADVTADVGTYNHASSSGNSGTWSGSANEIVLTIGTSGQIQLYEIEYTTSSGSTCEHVWGDGEITTAATCTTDGVRTYTCSKCGETKTESIAALGHDWVAGTIHAPTCTENGYTEYECSRCHEEKHDDVVEALGHNYVDGVCTRCGAEEPDETTVTFIPGTDTGETSVSKNGITATMSKMDNGDYYQIFANSSGTFTSDENILKIEFVCTASGTAKYGPGNTTADVGDYSYSGTTGTWTGSAKSVTLSSTAQVRMSSLEITREGGELVEYTITYDGNGSDGGSMSPTTGTSPKVRSCGFTKTGYTFVRWNTQSNGEGTDYDVNTIVSQDIKLYAIWEVRTTKYVFDFRCNRVESSDSTSAFTTSNWSQHIEGVTAEDLTVSAVNDKVYPGKNNSIKFNSGDTNGTITFSITEGLKISKVLISAALYSGDTGSKIKVNTLDAVTLTDTFTYYSFDLGTGTSDITIAGAKADKGRFYIDYISFIAVDQTAAIGAYAFGADFLNATNEGCSNKSGISSSTWTDLSTEWSGLETTYAGSQDYFLGKSPNAEGSAVSEALARYDNIVSKYQYEDFLSRTNVSMSRSSTLFDNSFVTPVIVISSVVALTFVGGYFLLRKRKEEK